MTQSPTEQPAGALDQTGVATTLATVGPALGICTRSGRAFVVQEIVATLHGILTGKSERESAQRNALIAFTVRVASAAILYLSQIALARWMGGTQYGIYVFVWTWVVVLGGIAHGGFNLSLIRLSSEYRENGQFSLLHGIVRTSRLFTLAISTLIMGLGLAGLWLFEPLSSAYILPAYLALVCVPLYALTFVQDGLARGFGWITAGLVPTYILRPLMILAAMYGANLLGWPMSATTAAGAAIIATYVMAIAQIVLIDHRIKKEIPAAKPTYDYKNWAVVSAPLLGITTCELLLQNTDILIISRYLPATDVGIYFAAAKTMSLIMFIHYAVGSAVAHRFSALKARGNDDELKSFVKDAVNWTFWPSLAGAAIILSLGPFLLSMFGPQFTAGYPVMGILVVGFLFRSAIGPVDFLLNMLGEQKLCAISLAATAALNILLNFILVPMFGLIGAATATSISLVFAGLLHYIIARRRLGIDMGIWCNLPNLRING